MTLWEGGIQACFCLPFLESCCALLQLTLGYQPSWAARLDLLASCLCSFPGPAPAQEAWIGVAGCPSRERLLQGHGDLAEYGSRRDDQQNRCLGGEGCAGGEWLLSVKVPSPPHRLRRL